MNNEIKTKKEIYIHKIAGLGDEVPDVRTYDEACQGPKVYLDQRYAGILNFESLPTDYTEEDSKLDSIHRYNNYIGGQYSCLFKGVYIKKFPNFKISAGSTFMREEMKGVSFDYPQIEGFETKETYNKDKKTAEITYFSEKNVIPNSFPPAHRHPMLIVQKVESKGTEDYSIDKRSINSSGILYKTWNDHDSNSYYLNNPYDNLDTTLEINVSEIETYLISTVNFIYNGISEQIILDSIANSFKYKKNTE